MGKSAVSAAGVSDTTLIGDYATAAMSSGANPVGGDGVVIGTRTAIRNWRDTVIGYNSHALKVSSTVVGAHADTNAIHGDAIGRGAINETDGAIQFAAKRIMLNAHANAGYYYEFEGTPHVDCNNGAVWREPQSYPAIVSGMHGLDVDAGTYNDIVGGGHTNTRGGNVELHAGRGTGTAAGGDVVFKSSAVGGETNNVLNAAKTLATIYATGDIELHTAGAGIILASPNGTRYKLTVDNDGVLGTAAL